MKGSIVRKSAAVLTGLGIVAGSVAMAAPAQAGVTLCKDKGYGNCRDFGVGNVTWVGDAWSDAASSLSVTSPAAYTVVYRDVDYRGPSKNFQTGSPDLSTFMMTNDRNWDDEISSLW